MEMYSFMHTKRIQFCVSKEVLNTFFVLLHMLEMEIEISCQKMCAKGTLLSHKHWVTCNMLLQSNCLTGVEHHYCR